MLSSLLQLLLIMEHFSRPEATVKNLLAEFAALKGLAVEIGKPGDKQFDTWLEDVKNREGDINEIEKEDTEINAVLHLDDSSRRVNLNMKLFRSVKAVKDLKEIAVEIFLSGIPEEKLQRFSEDDLISCTSRPPHEIGSGGFAKVYKGQLASGVQVAIKILERQLDVEEIFMREISTILKVSHPNIIQLYGFCSNAKMKALVYEFMEKGSLDVALFEKVEWEVMYGIATNIAKALAYLHHGCGDQIIHLDVKPSNVLLDSNHFPKVTDFGTTRIMNKGMSHFTAIKCIGTCGYIAPEVGMMLEKVTYKCDVFSFGKVLFDILGMRTNTQIRHSLPKQVWQNYNKEELGVTIKECGFEKEDIKKARILSMVGLWCIQHTPERRPSMNDVVSALEEKIEIHKPPDPFLVCDEDLSMKHLLSPSTSEREKDLDEVLQSHTVSSNVSKGVLAKSNDLEKAFGTDDHSKIRLEILNKGELQIAGKERESQSLLMFKDKKNLREKDLDEVLQSHTVSSNVSKGVLAKSKDLEKAFGTDDHSKICLEILNEGELQIAGKERESESLLMIEAEKKLRGKDLGEVLRSHTVSSNVSKGVLTKSKDLEKAFGTDDHSKTCLEILNKGELQISGKERESQSLLMVKAKKIWSNSQASFFPRGTVVRHSKLQENVDILAKEVDMLKRIRDEMVHKKALQMASWLEIVKGKVEEAEELLKEFRVSEKGSKHRLNIKVIDLIKSVIALKEAGNAISGVFETLLTDITGEKPKRFTHANLRSFTSNFSNPIDSHHDGNVYKGCFPTGVHIVVKKVEEKDVDEEIFMAEMRTMFNTSHRNVIKLYGFCFERNMKALVFEYAPNGSLDRILFNDHHKKIEWAELYSIATETAKGLLYLHDGSEFRLLHCDLKPSNVLLDSYMCPKVSNFGASKFMSWDRTHQTVSHVRGDPSYSAPEIMSSRKVTPKYDVYSFGMILFEVLGRRRNIRGRVFFPREVWKKFANREIEEIMKECGIAEKNREKAMLLCMVAFWCIQYTPENRPTISTVVKMLEKEIKVAVPPDPFVPSEAHSVKPFVEVVYDF